jgi:hypothetical protein
MHFVRSLRFARSRLIALRALSVVEVERLRCAKHCDQNNGRQRAKRN